MIRKAIFSSTISYMQFADCCLFMCIGQRLYILNMDGVEIEDVDLPSGQVRELFKHKDMVFLFIEGHGYYHFRLNDSRVTQLEWKAEKMRAGSNVLFSCGGTLSLLDLPTSRPEHIVTVPENIVDFAEVGPDIYILLPSHLCLVHGWARPSSRTSIRPIEFLSNLGFISMSSSASGFLALENSHTVVIYKKGAARSAGKALDCRGYKLFDDFLVIQQPASMELYSLDCCKMLMKLDFRSKAIAYDSRRKMLWVYSDSLYEIDVSGPLSGLVTR